MLTLVIKRGRTNVIHQARVSRLIGNPELPWTVLRFQQFTMAIGAHEVGDSYVDWWGWVYQLEEFPVGNS
jgi:hypothetical protein